MRRTSTFLKVALALVRLSQLSCCDPDDEDDEDKDDNEDEDEDSKEDDQSSLDALEDDLDGMLED